MEQSSTSSCRAAALLCDQIIVLVLDDDDGFRTAVADNLRDDGHPVLECASCDAVPPPARLGEVALVVTDYHLPVGNGLAFADAFHAAHPQVPIVLVTAQWADDLAVQAAARGFLHLLRKPVDYTEFHALLHRLVRTVPRAEAAA